MAHRPGRAGATRHGRSGSLRSARSSSCPKHRLGSAPVSLDDWVKALHVLSAFALVGAMTLLWVGYLATRAADSASPGLARFFTIGEILTQVGIAGTLVFG